MLLVVLWIEGLENLRSGRAQYWYLLPVLMFFWANLHGGFVIGFVIFLTYALGLFWERRHPPETEPLPPLNWRAWIGVGGLSFIASFFNPAGAGIWTTSVGFLGNRYLLDITVEYFSVNFHNPNVWPFAALLLVSVFLVWRNGVRLRPVHFLLLASWMMMGLYSVRNIPLYALIAAPILAELVARNIRAHPAGSGRGWDAFWARESHLQSVETRLHGNLWPVAAVLLTAGMLAAGFQFDIARSGYRFSTSAFPVGAVDWAEANPPSGNMFNEFTWGGYLLYRLWPEHLVFIDGQTDFYGEKLTREYMQVYEGDAGWQDVLARYHVRWAIIPSESPLAKRLQNELGWKVVYRDSVAVILVAA
jgi:hypothetical protein